MNRISMMLMLGSIWNVQAAVPTVSYVQYETIYLYGKQSDYYYDVRAALDSFGVRYHHIDTVIPHDKKNLYILFDITDFDANTVPRYYIVCQTRDLTQTPLTNAQRALCTQAVAVWDYSWDNIRTYNGLVNYYYFPKDYAYTDPVILPCFLPLRALDVYREMLMSSNSRNTEISSHVPILFFHTYLRDPQLIVEAGVCLGDSSKVFSRINQLLNSHLIGLDNDKNALPAYHGLTNSTFVLIDDVHFPSYYSQSEFKDTPIDVIFIDTSHQYDHTMAEIKTFLPLLAPQGIIMFHDANVTPLKINGRPAFERLNGTVQVAAANPFGVAPAIKHYFNIEFDVTQYVNRLVTKDGVRWHMIHYPFCNGITIFKKQS